jgi:hypothetical protein
MSNDTAARLAALEAKVAQLETANARLVDVASRFFDLIADRTLWAVEEFVARDQEAAETQVELETAIRSRAPRGFKFPVVVHETIVENQPKHFWVMNGYRQMMSLSRITRLEYLLEKKGVISSQDQSDLAVGGGDDSEKWEKRMRECFPDYDT